MTDDENYVFRHLAKGHQHSFVPSNFDLLNVSDSSNKSLSVMNTSEIFGSSVLVTVESVLKSDSYPTQLYIFTAKGNEIFPYRTNTFFGFRSPNKIPILTHFHIPIVPSSYLGRSRSTSLSNVFDTERYLYMSNDSLRRIIKKKLNFEHVHLPLRHRYYRNLEIDFEYIVDVDSNNNNHFEHISEVCDARLRNVLHRNVRDESCFLEKLGNIQYARSLSPQSDITSTGNRHNFLSYAGHKRITVTNCA